MKIQTLKLQQTQVTSTAVYINQVAISIPKARVVDIILGAAKHNIASITLSNINAYHKIKIDRNIIKISQK